MFETKGSLLKQKTPRMAQGLTVGIFQQQSSARGPGREGPSEDELNTSQGWATQVPPSGLALRSLGYHPPGGRPALGGHLAPSCPIPAEIVDSSQIATLSDCVINGNIGNLTHFSQRC